MPNKRRLLFFTVGVTLILVTLACSIPGLSGTTSGPADNPSGDSAAAPDVPAGDDDVPLTYTGTGASNLSSYRSQFTLTYSGTDDTGTAVNGSFTMNVEATTNPPANRFIWEMEDSSNNAEMGSFDMTQIGDVVYMITSEAGGEPQCISLPADGGLAEQSPAFSPDSMLENTDLSGARRILPNEQINGVMTRHYRATATEAVLFGFDNYTIDIWVAIDGGYPVRQVMVGDGTMTGLFTGSGHVEWTYDLLDINVPVDIQPPAGCEAPGGGDFPQMADATGVTSMGGLLTYTTASPIADVVAFYQAQLPPLGWVAGTASTDVPGFATLEFTRGDEHVSITISGGDGATTVLIGFE